MTDRPTMSSGLGVSAGQEDSKAAIVAQEVPEREAYDLGNDLYTFLAMRAETDGQFNAFFLAPPGVGWRSYSDRPTAAVLYVMH